MFQTYLPLLITFVLVGTIAAVMFAGGQFVGPKN
jgi:NADH:ubiquinone oxidoreductase subunit 3 (subunit A)